VTAPYQASLHSNAIANAFLTVIGQNGTTGNTYIEYSTYLGGSESDVGQGVAIGALNEVYVTGTSTFWDFPWRDNFQPFNGSADAFIAKLNLARPGVASLIYATPLGGTAPAGIFVNARGNDIATDGAGHVYATGATTAGDFPTVVSTSGIMNGFQPICSSCQGTSPQYATVKAGQTATYSLVIFSPNGYTGSVALACGGAPPQSVCAPSLSAVTLPAQFAVTVTTTANSFVSLGKRRELNPGDSPKTLELLSISVTFIALLLSWVLTHPKTQQHSRLAFLSCAIFLLISAMALVLAACGSGSAGGSSSSADPGTPAQTYPLSLTGTAADGTTRTLNLTLNVQ
jgi:hypothetical protein